MAVHDNPLMLRQQSRRRKTVALLGCAGAGMLFGMPRPQAQEQPACIARPEQTEGPYFVDTKLNRSDIRTDTASGTISPGIPLVLTFIVSHMDGENCTALRNAHIEIWQCDAHGIYSGVRDPSFDTTGQDFLRGHQETSQTRISWETALWRTLDRPDSSVIMGTIS